MMLHNLSDRHPQSDLMSIKRQPCPSVRQVVQDVVSSLAAMVLTTATVQSGASGGAVLSASGALVALVTRC